MLGQRRGTSSAYRTGDWWWWGERTRNKIKIDDLARGVRADRSSSIGNGQGIGRPNLVWSTTDNPGVVQRWMEQRMHPHRGQTRDGFAQRRSADNAEILREGYSSRA